ncbi:MAG: hypothetical protein IJJ26_09970 [Victivallales bacterium]|nr:hypothetical protein [Victivallales bacterium]
MDIGIFRMMANNKKTFVLCFFIVLLCVTSRCQGASRPFSRLIDFQNAMRKNGIKRKNCKYDVKGELLQENELSKYINKISEQVKYDKDSGCYFNQMLFEGDGNTNIQMLPNATNEQVHYYMYNGGYFVQAVFLYRNIHEEREQICRNCNGSGRIVKLLLSGQTTRTCPICHGRGSTKQEDEASSHRMFSKVRFLMYYMKGTTPRMSLIHNLISDYFEGIDHPTQSLQVCEKKEKQEVKQENEEGIELRNNAGKGRTRDVYQYAKYLEEHLDVGSKSIRTDVENMLIWMTKAADQGSSEACIKLGEYYEGVLLEEYIPKSIDKACRYYKKAIFLGHPEGMEHYISLKLNYDADIRLNIGAMAYLLEFTFEKYGSSIPTQSINVLLTLLVKCGVVNPEVVALQIWKTYQANIQGTIPTEGERRHQFFENCIRMDMLVFGKFRW